MSPVSKDGERTDDTEDPAESALDAVLHHVALEAMDGESTERSHQWASDLARKTQSQIAALRRRRTPAEPVIASAQPVPAEYQALHRMTLLARLELLRHVDNVQYAHLDLTGLSDDDLRRLLARLEAHRSTER